MQVIYDIGSNNGDDLKYYLLKADKVVAVEANPMLCQKISAAFSREIETGRLVVENCAITDKQSGVVDFYINIKYHFLSSLIAPGQQNKDKWQAISIEAMPISQLIRKHGEPYYIKIDIEGYDEAILSALAEMGIKPPYISAESHTLGVFTVLAEKLGYKSFKLVDGDSVSKLYSKRRIFSPIEANIAEYSFPFHSAGPFGDDIDGPWLSKDSLLRILALQGLGWKDIHATTMSKPQHIRSLQYWLYINQYFFAMVFAKFKHLLRRTLPQIPNKAKREGLILGFVFLICAQVFDVHRGQQTPAKGQLCRPYFYTLESHLT